MTAPTRVVTADSGTYALDPYVRDTAGRFAEHPTQPLPPLQVLEASGTVETLYDGRVHRCSDGATYWRVRTIREEDGTFRVLYLEEDEA